MEQKLLIGIAGPARSGKDTVAWHLCREYGFMRTAFADQLKAILLPLFGWDERHKNGYLKEEVDPYWGFSPRQAYQKFGTEFGRALNPDLWVLMMHHQLQHYGNRVVISDVRFPNEANYVRRNGILVHVFRQLKYRGEVARHSSEAPLAIYPSDLAVSNNGTIAELHEQIDSALKCYIP